MMRRSATILFALLLLAENACVMAQTQTEACHVATADFPVNVRRGPSTMNYGVVGTLAVGDVLVASGRSTDGNWYAVDYKGRRAWVAAWVVSAWGACVDLPTVPAPAPSPYLAELQAVPALPTLNAHVHEIFARGQERGNNANVFAKIGDCNTESTFFLFPLDRGNYDLGPYGELQETVNFFAGSFIEESVAGYAGFTSFSMLDPTFADPERCEAGESPLACEYRRLCPSVALIGLGSNDTRYLTIQEYARYMRQIVELTLEADIIPVLSTFSERTNARWEKSLEVNMIMVEIAREYDIPLINFWRGARALPEFGLIERSTRLSHGWQPGDPIRIDFSDGQETQWGHALHNLLTLQTLDALRRDVLSEAPP